tara:strand:+ start:134 stop:571 length:438 start_codon:yes stop_codon:yes gene_type:complete
MNISGIQISLHVINNIKQASIKSYPGESCGLLFGNSKLVMESVVSPNLSDKLNRFEIDPSLRLKSEREMRKRKIYLVGHFHSHPNGLPVPSSIDKKNIYEPKLIWFIISVNQFQCGKLTAWKANKNKKSFKNLKIFPTNTYNFFR